MADRSPRELELEMENAFLRGRVEELQDRVKSAEAYANEVMHEGCDCDKDNEDVRPGDIGTDETNAVGYCDDFGAFRYITRPTGEN